MNSFWKAALAVGGTATVGAFVLWSIYKQWLSLSIFPQLTQEQAFSLFRYLLILTFLAFAILALVYVLRPRGQLSDETHVFALHSSWDDVNAVDPNDLVGPDVTNGVRALAITATSWERGLVPKNVIIDSHFDDFEILFKALVDCPKIVPGFEKEGTKCADLITPRMTAAYNQMKLFKEKKANK